MEKENWADTSKNLWIFSRYVGWVSSIGGKLKIAPKQRIFAVFSVGFQGPERWKMPTESLNLANPTKGTLTIHACKEKLVSNCLNFWDWLTNDVVNTFCRVIVQIEELILVRPRRSKKINAKKINNMDDAHDSYGHGKYATGKNPRDPQEGRKTLQCWRCGGPHLCRSCPHA